jgi:hypothetical protein
MVNESFIEILGEVNVAHLNIQSHNLPIGSGKNQEKVRVSQFLTGKFN